MEWLKLQYKKYEIKYKESDVERNRVRKFMWKGNEVAKETRTAI